MSNTTEIAKAIRADIKAAFPKLKVSVVCDHFSGGSSINVKIKDTAGVVITSAEYLSYSLANPHQHCPLNRHTAEATALLNAVDAVARKYHVDNSDPQTDYFNCNFYLSVGFASDTERADRELVTEQVKRDALDAPAPAAEPSAQERFLSMLGL